MMWTSADLFTSYPGGTAEHLIQQIAKRKYKYKLYTHTHTVYIYLAALTERTCGGVMNTGRDVHHNRIPAARRRLQTLKLVNFRVEVAKYKLR